MNPNRLPKTLHFCIVANRRLFAPRIALRSIPVWGKGLALSTGRAASFAASGTSREPDVTAQLTR
jgi:hypothetical protein